MMANGRGGARPGAGRPKGSKNRWMVALADQFLDDGNCPASALVRIARRAEKNGDDHLAVDAWKAVLPYIHPKPKPVEIYPDYRVELEQRIAEAKSKVSGDDMDELARLVEEARARVAKGCLTELGQSAERGPYASRN